MKMKASAILLCGTLAIAPYLFATENESNEADYEVIEAGAPLEIEETTFSEDSSVGVMNEADEAQPESAPVADKQEIEGVVENEPPLDSDPKILKVSHSAQYENAKPKVESEVGDWVFDYPK